MEDVELGGGAALHLALLLLPEDTGNLKWGFWYILCDLSELCPNTRDVEWLVKIIKWIELKCPMLFIAYSIC